MGVFGEKSLTFLYGEFYQVEVSFLLRIPRNCARDCLIEMAKTGIEVMITVFDRQMV